MKKSNSTQKLDSPKTLYYEIKFYFSKKKLLYLDAIKLLVTQERRIGILNLMLQFGTPDEKSECMKELRIFNEVTKTLVRDDDVTD